MGKKIIDFKAGRDALRGRKSKAGGGNQKRLNYIHPCKMAWYNKSGKFGWEFIKCSWECIDFRL